MLNDKEKLIELIGSAPLWRKPSFSISEICPQIADILIANGVTVQKRGHWEKYGYKWKCNNCLAKINIDGTPEENGLYYCPNCGADMKGAKHEID